MTLVLLTLVLAAEFWQQNSGSGILAAIKLVSLTTTRFQRLHWISAAPLDYIGERVRQRG
jgi:hypothetical protein